MRSFFKARAVSWCVLIASVLGAPIASNAAEPSKASPARTVVASTSVAPVAVHKPAQQPVQKYGDLPLSFEVNDGQANRDVRFLSRGSGYTFFLTPAEAVLAFSKDNKDNDSRDAILHMRLEGSNSGTDINGRDPLPGTSNYFVGNNPNHWRTGIPTFRKVAYENIYPGINLVYYGSQRQLEYDFVVSPGADPKAIRLSVSGASNVTVDAEGNLVLGISQGQNKNNEDGSVRILAPKAYQTVNGERRSVAGQWRLAKNGAAGFVLGSYDHHQTLVIDPVLLYSSFLGGSENTSITRIATDSEGNAYVAGYTAAGNFPAAPTPQSSTFGGGTASRGAFVAKIDPTGSSLIYTTYLSGSVGEQASGLAVDASGNVYLTGNTQSLDFPVLGAFQSTCAVSAAGTCSDAFLTKIASAGNALVYSTYLGGTGNDSASGVVVDATGNAYVAGLTSSKDFPATTGAAQIACGGSCSQNAFVAKFGPTGATLAYATYLGGSGSDAAADIAIDASGSTYITGQTSSPDFPLASPFQKACTLNSTGACVATSFVAKLKGDGSGLTYSTYLGGSLGSQAAGIAVDGKGSAYVTGSTQSADFPVQNALQKSCGINAASSQCAVNAFVTKLTPAGTALVYSTYLGGSTQDQGAAIAVDAAGNAHVVGTTASANFPTVKPIQPKLNGASDAFVAVLNSTGKALTFSTFHGGSSTESGSSLALDAKGNVYLAGQTSSTDFPTLTPFQSSCAGTCSNAFVSKMSVTPQDTAASVSATGGTPQTTNVSTAFPTALQATVLDSSSNPIAGVSVTFTVVPATNGASGTFTGSLTTVTETTGDGTGGTTLGVAVAPTFTANATAGNYTVSATVTGVTTAAPFLLINAGTPSAIAASGGTPQTASVSTAFAVTLQATVTDSNNNLVPGASVTFTAPSTGASGTFAGAAAPGTSITVTTGTSGASLGIAAAPTFTANGTAGSYTVSATVTGVSAAAHFSLINAGAPSSIAATGNSTPQTADVSTAFATNLQATVKDSNSNLVPNVSVTFAAPGSGASGTFSGATAPGTSITVTTGASGPSLGIATAPSFTANATAGGPYTVTATAGAVGPANFSLINAGPPASIQVVPATNNQSTTVNTAFGALLQATVKDSNGNLVPGASVTFAAPGSGASGTFTGAAAPGTSITVTTGTSGSTLGVAAAPAFTANAVSGTYNVSATVGAFSVNFSLTNTAGAPNSIMVVSSTNNQSATEQTAFTTALEATVLDASNNPVPNVSVTFTPVAGTTGATGTFTGSAAVTTNSSGVAMAPTLTASATAGAFTVSANTTSTPLTTPAVFSLTVNVGPPATIVATTGGGQSVAINTAFPTGLTATVKDSGGNLVPSASVTFTATTATNNANGTFTGAAAPGTSITVTTGTSGSTLGVAAAPTLTANSHVGTFTVTANTSPSVTTAATYSLSITHGQASTITVTGGNNQSVPAGTAFTALQATVTDNGTNPVPGVSVVFTAPASGASGVFSNNTNTITVTTGSGTGGTTLGVAVAAFTANCILGTPSVSATVTGVTTPATYSLTITVGAPKTVTPVTGSTPQSTPVTDAFSTALGATVTDCGGNAEPAGITVTFTAPAGGATGTFANGSNTDSEVTSASGVATATTFTASRKSGTYSVSGTVTGATTNATYSLTNTSGPPAAIAPTTGATPQSTTVGTAFAALGALVTDSNGNPVQAGVPVTFTATSTTGAIGTFMDTSTTTTTANTNAVGIATPATFTANTVASQTPYTVTASTTGATNGTYSLTNLPGPAATITVGSGTTPQNIAVTNVFGSTLSGTVTDQYGNAVLAGVNVKLTAPSGAVASGTFSNSSNASTVSTTVAGTFVSSAFTANSTPGAYNVAAVSGAASAQYALVNTDFSLTSTTPSIYIQGSSTPLATSAAPIITVTPLPAMPPAPASYTGTVTLACVAASLPTGVTCPSFTPASAVFTDGSPTSVLSTASVSIGAATPVGLYQTAPVMVAGADGSTKTVTNTTSFALAVECTYSFGNTASGSTLPTYSPLIPVTPYTFSVSEDAGGTACPWNDLTTTAGVTGIPASSDQGTITATGTGTSIPFGVTSLPASAGAPQIDSVSVSYFQVNGASTTGTSTLSVYQEPAVTLTGGVGTTDVLLTANSITAANPGTLAFPNAVGLGAGVTTICGAENSSGPDTSGNNYFITCSAQVTGNTATLAVTIGPATPASRPRQNRAQLELLYSAGLGFPAIVFMGLGAAAFGPKRKRPALRRIASLLGVLLVLSFLLILPACSGGFSANFINPSQVGSYNITVMGYVTDSNNDVTSIEIFTVPMNVVK